MSVILGQKWALPDAKGHFRELVWEAAARWGSCEGENWGKASLETVRSRPPADHLFLPGSAARADWLECCLGTGSGRCPSPVKPRQQLRVLSELAEKLGEPDRSECGAVAA